MLLNNMGDAALQQEGGGLVNSVLYPLLYIGAGIDNHTAAIKNGGPSYMKA